jgi:hypothetical protein
VTLVARELGDRHQAATGGSRLAVPVGQIGIYEEAMVDLHGARLGTVFKPPQALQASSRRLNIPQKLYIL